MVFCVGFEMCGQTLNLLGQERNLYFGGSGISLMYMKLLNDLVFTYRFRHAQPFFFFVLFSFPLRYCPNLASTVLICRAKCSISLASKIRKCPNSDSTSLN